MKTLIIAAILLGVPLFAQVAVVSPLSVDGTTITVDASHVMHCTASSSLPTGMTFDGHTLSVPAIDLTGGAATPDGTYTLTSTSGTLTLTPYTPAGGNLALSSTQVSVASSSIAASATVSTAYTLAGVPAPGTGAVVFLNPSIDLTQNGTLRYAYRVTAANTITLTITNTVGSARTIPAYTLYLSAIH